MMDQAQYESEGETGQALSHPHTESSEATMKFQSLVVDVGKLILCGLLFFIGTMLGGMIASMLQLGLPAPPQGADLSAIQLYMLLTAPLPALALAVLARALAGNVWTRAIVLSFFMWIVYTVNTQLEATIVSTYATGFWFAVVSGLIAALCCGGAVAFLFPPKDSSASAREAFQSFAARNHAIGWIWRLALAAVIFMPIYFAFGLMVLPFTGEYYREQMFGLVAPTIESLLPILFTRSVLFLLACLPIIILWQESNRALFGRLGLALFFLVGFVIMLYATWLPLYVRLPHTLEILAGEFVYAGALALLLGQRHTAAQQDIAGGSQVTA